MPSYILRRLLSDRSDLVRDHGAQFPHRAGRARRPDGADRRPAAWNGCFRTARFGGSGAAMSPRPAAMTQTGIIPQFRGIPARKASIPEIIKELENQFGFDQPLYKRFGIMMWNYMRFDFGKSYFRDERVFHAVISRMPVSISIGLWTTLLVYLISIPLGIRKAMKDGTPSTCGPAPSSSWAMQSPASCSPFC